MKQKMFNSSSLLGLKVRRCLLTLVLSAIFSGLPLGLFASEQPPAESAITGLNQYQTVGEGKYSYWFWDLYQARFATPSGKFSTYQQSAPLLLELHYLRDISKREFIDATLEQWQIQTGGVQKEHKLWAGELTALWRDVKKGDMLSAELHSDGLVSFYFNQQSLGTTKDPALGPAFFDIWLSEKTTAPKLRKRLLALP